MFSEFSADINGFDAFIEIIKTNLYKDDFINTEERIINDTTVDEHNNRKIISDCLRVAYDNKLPFEYYDEEKLKEFFQTGIFTEDVIKMFIGCGAFESVLSILKKNKKENKEMINSYHITRNHGYNNDAQDGAFYINPECDICSIYSKFPSVFWKCMFSNIEYFELFLNAVLYMKPLTEEQKDDILAMVFGWSSGKDDFDTFVRYISRDIKLIFMISVFVFKFSIETPYKECYRHHIYAYKILRRVLEKKGIYQWYDKLNDANRRPIHDIPYINENRMYWTMNDVYDIFILSKVDKVNVVKLDINDNNALEEYMDHREGTPEKLIAQIIHCCQVLWGVRTSKLSIDEISEKKRNFENDGYTLMTIMNYLAITNDINTFKYLLMSGFSFMHLATNNSFEYTYTVYRDEEYGDFEEEHTDTINGNIYLTPEMFRLLEQRYGSYPEFKDGFGHMINHDIAEYMEIHYG